jgi:WD40 repeat protein
VGGVDGRINVWDYSTIKKRFSVLLQEAVTKLMWTPDDLKLVAASMDATVSVWDARTADNIKIYQGHQAGILDFDINGNIIVTGSDDGTCLCFGLE